MGKHTTSTLPTATLRAYAKAAVGFLAPVVVSLAATADGGWTTGELLTALGAGLVTAAGVGVVPNRGASASASTTTTTQPLA